METPNRAERGRRQVLSTYLATLLLIIGRLMVYKWSPEVFDEENFALYVIGLRGLSLGYLALGPALVTGLTYQVARTLENPEERDGAYLWSAHLLSLFWFVPVLFFIVIAPGLCAKFTLGSAVYGNLMLPLVLCLIGQYVAVTALAFKMGKTHVLAANAIGVLMGFVVPVVCLWYFHESTLQVFWAMAVSTLISAALMNLWLLLTGVDRSVGNFRELKEHASRLYKYTIPRLPAAAGVTLILALPVLIPAQYTEDLSVGAIFAAGGALIGVASSVIQPMALVLLPHAAQMLAKGSHPEVLKKAKFMLKGLTAAAVFATGVAVISTPWILEAWLGPEALVYSSFWVGLTPAMLPIVLYRAFASLLNAASPVPYDSWNVGISLLLFGALYLMASSLAWEIRLLLAFSGSLYGLAGLTIWRTLQLLKTPSST